MSLNEKLTPSQGASKYISDFEKSDAPQFAGKSKSKRREMAIAAFMSAKKDKQMENFKPFNQFMSELEEGRGRPRKNPPKPKAGEEDDHEYGGHDSGEEPDQHIHVQLKKAESIGSSEVKAGREGYKMKGGADVKFKSGTHFVKSEHAKAVNDALSKLKPESRNELHKHIAQSHENFMSVHKLVTSRK